MNPTEAAWRWAETWQQYWEALDAEPILALYAPGVRFSSEPFRTPYLGVDGVAAYVRPAFAEERSPVVLVADPIVEGDRAAVAWWASLEEEGEEITLAGVSMLRFDGDGLVVDQWDAWNRSPGRIDPPEGTLF